jgi:hypothetical protein
MTSPFSLHHTSHGPHDLSSVRVERHQVRLFLTRTGTPAQFTRTEGIAISEQAPSLRHVADKTGPSDGDDRYGNPVSKIRSDRMAVRPHPQGDGAHDYGLDFRGRPS